MAKTPLAVVVFLSITLFTPLSGQQQLNKVQRETSRQMMRDVADAVRKHYYDPKFHGIDMDARFKAADEKISQATSFSEVFASIAESIDPLNDSHTYFLPPNRATRREWGYYSEMIGDRCYVVAVRPGSDASKKLAPGDEVVAFERYMPTRDTFWKLNYIFTTLYANTSVHLVTRSPDGTERQLEVAAKLHQGKRVLDLTSDADIWQTIRELENDDRANRQRLQSIGPTLMVWKMPEFELTPEEMDRVLKDARKYPNLILDLRGNPGGLVKTLEMLTGVVMDHDVTIAKRVGRKSDLKPQQAKSRGKEAYSGKLIVLIDSRSASAAELFARVVQLEHRGTVIGDRSSGSVMEARHYPFDQGANTIISYGASVTDADLIMADGRSLEHEGVIPDEVLLPAPADLAAGRDPVLARAAKVAGVDLDPVQAGKIFPIEWRQD